MFYGTSSKQIQMDPLPKMGLDRSSAYIGLPWNRSEMDPKGQVQFWIRSGLVPEWSCVNRSQTSPVRQDSSLVPCKRSLSLLT